MEYNFTKKEKTDFHPVSDEEILQLETSLEIKIPNELKKLYKQSGYGFINVGGFNVDRIMDTYSIVDFRTKTGIYENYPYIDGYEAYEEAQLFFFEQNESAYMSIELTNAEEAKIYYEGTVIANSLSEFLEKMIENDQYYFDLEN